MPFDVDILVTVVEVIRGGGVSSSCLQESEDELQGASAPRRHALPAVGRLPL